MHTREILIIGVDGVYSQIRAMMFPKSPRPQFTGQSVRRYKRCCPPGLEAEKAFYADCWGLEPVPSDDGMAWFMAKWAEMAEKAGRDCISDWFAETLDGSRQ